MPWIFNYSELSVQDITKLIGNSPLCAMPATSADHRVVFRGHTRKWGGSIASIERKKGHTVYGSALLLYQEELNALDKVMSHYTRIQMPVILTTEDVCKAYVYVLSDENAPVGDPSPEYTKAILKHLKFFWDSNEDSKLTLEDFIPSSKPTPVAVPTAVEQKPVKTIEAPKRRGRPPKIAKEKES